MNLGLKTYGEHNSNNFKLVLPIPFKTFPLLHIKVSIMFLVWFRFFHLTLLCAKIQDQGFICILTYICILLYISFICALGPSYGWCLTSSTVHSYLFFLTFSKTETCKTEASSWQQNLQESVCPSWMNLVSWSIYSVTFWFKQKHPVIYTCVMCAHIHCPYASASFGYLLSERAGCWSIPWSLSEV